MDEREKKFQNVGFQKPGKHKISCKKFGRDKTPDKLF